MTLLVPARADAQREAPLVLQRQAREAVERDSTSAWHSRWSARVGADSADRAARLGLALLLDLTYDYPAATSAFRALSDTTAAAPDRYAAFARLAWARMDELRGAMGDAAAGYVVARRLAQRIGDRTIEGMVVASLTYLRANGISMEAGIATLDTAERLVPRDLPGLQSDLARRRATMLAVQIVPAARDTAEEAIRLARLAGDRRAEANAVRALALYHKMRGFSDSSEAALRITAQLQRDARDRRALSETLVRIADAQLTQRRLGEANITLQEAQREAIASHNDYGLAASETGLGDIALRVHDVPTAERHFARAADLNIAANDSGSLIVVRNYQVNALLDAGWLDSAWTMQRAIVAHFERTREITDLMTAHRGLASIAMARGDLDMAERELDTADSLVRHFRIPLGGPANWYDRARLARRRGNDARAAELLKRYLASLRPDDGVARWDVQVRLAEIEARTGDPRAAAERLADATDALERWRGAQSDSTLRLLAFQVSAHEEGDRDAYFARAIAALARRGQRISAFEQAERRRARTLAERIVQADALRANEKSGATAGRHHTAIDVSRATVAEISAALPDDRTALLEYVTGAGGAPTTLFVVTRRGARAMQLASADSLLPLLRRFVAAIASAEDVSSLARALGTALLDPALDSLDSHVTRLTIVPDGALHRVPFDALQLADGRAAIERYEISLAPSAAVATLLWRRPRQTGAGRPRVLAFGDPAFSEEHVASQLRLVSQDARVTRDAFSAAGRLARLPESGREARIAASYGTGSVLRLGAEATAAYLKHVPFGSFQVLHLATHALVDERSLLRSAVVLAPGDGESGIVSPGDLAALALGPELVVLSSCRSAGGVLVDGEGVQGLTAPLLADGARAVVATAWPIDDRATVSVMEDFYRELSKGATVGAALRTAKLAAMRSGSPARDWASFTVIGDPTIRIPLDPPQHRAIWIGVLAAVAILCGGVVAYRRWPAGQFQGVPWAGRVD